jgi:hypothetical protein
MPATSDSPHSSTIFRSATRAIWLAFMDTRFPVGGKPQYSPRWVPLMIY